MTAIRFERLSETNFKDYERLTSCESGGGCYCAFWHQKWTSMEGWDRQKKETPLKNRDTVLDRVRSNFHVGVLAYKGSELVAWLSVGPLTDYYWTWRRMVQVGEASRSVAGITCMAIAPELRGAGLQVELLKALPEYAKTAGWTRIEGYPFDDEVLKKHGKHVTWPGTPQGFMEAGFTRIAAHWLNSPEYGRSIYALEIGQTTNNTP